LGIGLVAFAPLSRGFLSGRLTSPEDLAPGDLRRDFPRFQGENFARNLAVVEHLKRLAGEMRATPSQLAIAWLLAQGDDVVPIPGAERRHYLEENLGAVKVRLTPEDLGRHRAAGVAWGGGRGPLRASRDGLREPLTESVLARARRTRGRPGRCCSASWVGVSLQGPGHLVEVVVGQLGG
jgi:diketogulonate reductase-like aldo/keto reductase